MSNEVIDKVLEQTTIPGLDIADAVARLGNNPKIYVRILQSFIASMPENLEELATSNITAETLPDYAIKIHGAKGSCYNIGANAVGDLAKSLEIASKAGNLETCLNTNDAFLQGAKQLIDELKILVDKIDEAQNSGKFQDYKPSANKLAALLAATQSFDIDEMTRIVEDLTSVQYTHDQEIIDRIKESFNAFDYSAIEETVLSYL